MLSRAIPYEGNEPYIFLSYSHKDAPRVYPLLEQMVRDGYRIWYDDGNHPGDDWLDNIAEHLNGCRVCLAMLSANSGASHNCRNEVNLARELDKKLMAVHLEQFDMPLGMRLQMGTIHYLKLYEYPSSYALLQKLYDTEAMAECRAEPGSLPMREAQEAAPEETPVPNPILKSFVDTEKQTDIIEEDFAPQPDPVDTQNAGEAIADEDIPVEVPDEIVPAVEVPEKDDSAEQEPAPEKKTTEEEAVVQPEPVKETQPKKKKVKKVVAKVKVAPAPVVEEQPVPVVEEQPAPVAEKQPAPVAEEQPAPVEEEQPADLNEQESEDWDEEDDCKTVYVQKEPELDDEDGEATVRVSRQKLMVLLHLSQGKLYILQSAQTRIGRSKKRCDIVVENNSAVSNTHADIIQINGSCYLRDVGSSNGTFIGGEKLEYEGQVKLECPAVFYLYNEPFMLVADDMAQKLADAGSACFLRSEKTGNYKLVDSYPMLLDRKHIWEDGTLDDNQISRKKHAWLMQHGDAVCLEDRDSTNGTYLNDQKLPYGPACELKAGDRIRLGETVLEFGMAVL